MSFHGACHFGFGTLCACGFLISACDAAEPAPIVDSACEPTPAASTMAPADADGPPAAAFCDTGS